MLLDHNNIDDDEDDYSDSEVNDDYQLIQLGFIDDTRSSKDFPINNLFHNPDWREWDGGKVGGQPVWLDPVHIPDTKSMICQYCEDPLIFLLQIYCPIDEIQEAFHRCLYIFCCRKKLCIDRSSIKCLRVQLPRQNPFYSLDPVIPCSEQHKESVMSKLPNLCKLCGCRAVNVCSSCKCSYYCSRLHQKEHWKDHKIVCSSSQNTIAATTTITHSNNLGSVGSSTQLKYLFPEHVIVVEPEELDGCSDEGNNNLPTTVSESTNIWDDAYTEGNADEDEDAKLTQKDYQRALQGEKAAEAHDPRYINFLTRISRGGSKQVLRYCRNTIYSTDVGNSSNGETSSIRKVRIENKGRLYLSSDLLVKESSCKQKNVRSHSCRRCGAPQLFEFQVMPQLLHYLNVDKLTKLSTEISSSSQNNNINNNPFSNQSNKDIDWGSIDVFTCSASCSILNNVSPLPFLSASNDETTDKVTAYSRINSSYQAEQVIMQPSISQKCSN